MYLSLLTEKETKMATANEFRSTLAMTFLGATRPEAPHIDGNARWLHRQIGNYPRPNHRMSCL